MMQDPCGEMRERLALEGLDIGNVTMWNGRPRRAARQSRFYFDEFVADDPWYRKKLLEDVPADELDAAIHDENFREDTASEASESDDNLPMDDESYASDASYQEGEELHGTA